MEMGHVNISFRNHDSMTAALNLRSQRNMTTSVLSEDIYLNWLDQTFQPVFSKYDKEEMPTADLSKSLCKDANGIPHQRLNRFLLRLDANKDGKVTYEEFRDFMINVEPRDRSFTKTILISLALKSCPDLMDSYLPSNIEDNVQRKEEMHRLKNELAESYLDLYTCYPPPIFIPLVVVAQLISFIIYGFQLINENNLNNLLSWTTGLPKTSPLIFDVRRRKEVWRFVSYMLIHQGYLHIIFNCFIQLLLGIPIEMVHKFWKVGPVFFAGVLFGSLASSIIDKTSLLVGSSGGSYALIGAHYAVVLMNWDELQRDWLKVRTSLLNFLGSGVVRLLFLTSFLGADFGVTLYRRLGLNLGERTSSSAHIGGLIAGLLIGIPCLRKTRKSLWKEKLFWFSLIIYTILLTFAILWNIFYPDSS